jgi:hypothetical protein
MKGSIVKYIYIAGPLYGSGHQDRNVKNALQIAEEVNKYDEEMVPFVPHLYFFWNFWHAYPPEYWLRMDKAWLAKCDAMIRIVGESPGSKLEEGWAEELDIPVHTLQIGLGQTMKVLLRISAGLPPQNADPIIPGAPGVPGLPTPAEISG